MIACLLGFAPAKADEGMWMLPFLKQLNEADMQSKGLTLSAEDIYSINRSSLKDAVLIFGNGCTGEVISDQGLVLTNHHCGFGNIQAHSSVEHDYLRNGFWAMTPEEELPNPGLKVTFIKEIVDVTDQIVPRLGSLDGKKREKKLEELIAEVLEGETPRIGQYAKAYGLIKPFFGGNQYLLFVMQEYPDVRLVGAPPSSIGKFGGDTDNWMWPRHTGDFSLFRIYADRNGNPAEYSKDNIPLKPVKYLPISLEGVEAGDFVMIMGFPGSTQRYMTAAEIDERTDILNASRIFVRGERQKLLLEDMKRDPKIRIQYASKYAGSSNYWKNSIGMNRGLAKLNVRDKKSNMEAQFTEWVSADPVRTAKYGQALPLIREAVASRAEAARAFQYFSETLVSGVEILKFAYLLGKEMEPLAGKKNLSPADRDALTAVKERAAGLYKDYNMPTDRKVAKRLFGIYADSVPVKYQVPLLNKLAEAYGGYETLTDSLYATSIFATETNFRKFLENPSAAKLKKDLAFRIGQDVYGKQSEIYQEKIKYDPLFDKGQRLFIAGLQEMNPEKVYYPDANFTLRLTYGQVLPYSPKDGVTYKHYTTLTGVMEKEDPDNAYEFEVPQRLKALYKAKDYGRYAKPGEELRVGMISNNDITGGNSGSPVINGKGELVGLAFDGNWEAMSGDIAFEPELQRTISVDIRYVLFLIDKYAGDTRLIDEMKIVK